MEIELKFLAYAALWNAVLFVPYVVANIFAQGAKRALSFHDDEAMSAIPRWAKLWRRAHRNSLESLIPFTAVVLVAVLAERTDPVTATAAAVFFWARIAHPFLMASGIPALRSIAFVTGWAAIMAIGTRALGWV